MKQFFLRLASLWVVSAIAELIPSKDQYSMVQRDGIDYKRFEHAATGGTIEYVTNSGICERTPGVNQYSGYFTVGEDMHMFFWFFESRKDPKTAPIAAWFNGGPGASSMIGLFQENGPCRFVDNSSSPSLNPFSWNSFANMLYIDQPIGTGFSYGNNQVNSTLTAAPYVWTFLQAFYASFPRYKNHDFGIFTESYGGHYGPYFARYLQQQNSRIASGSLNATRIPLVALGINNGWYDPAIQYKSYIDYSYNNSYRQLIKTKQEYDQLMHNYTTQCLSGLRQNCSTLVGNDTPCAMADGQCSGVTAGAIAVGQDFSEYDIREPFDNPYPPSTYYSYLLQNSVRKAIGARVNYTSSSNIITNFSNTGDNGRTFLPTLGQLVSSGIQVALIAGDADWVCNYQGAFGVVNAINWTGQAGFVSQPLESYTVNGNKTGLFKARDNLSWLQVFEAGHEVPYYQPATALQYFIQTMTKQALHST